MTKEKFSKLPTTPREQITLLKSRGMILLDEEFVHHCLSTVNYYRLSAYIKPFETEKSSHTINPRIDFNDVWNLYVFDRELRLLFLDALERIEALMGPGLYFFPWILTLMGPGLYFFPWIQSNPFSSNTQ